MDKEPQTKIQEELEEDNQSHSSGEGEGEGEGEFETYFNQVKLMKQDPNDYLAYCNANKKIKVMDQCNPILPNIYLKDISLHKKGPLEDKIYSKNNMYYQNIRRGNSLCEIYRKVKADGNVVTQLQKSQLFFCRRGMKKFYDLEPEYLKVNRKLTHQHQRYRDRIFEGLDELLNQQNHKIHLYCLFKQNGEHCQITYVRSQKKYQIEGRENQEYYQFWLFASKNVAILARNEQDLDDYYEKQRFYWAKLIGREFFKILSKFSQNQVSKFKEDILGKTLLGEHCGYEKHEHITKYQEIQLIFYGLVQNNGFEHCLPVRCCEAFLKNYGLKMSKMQCSEGLTIKNKVYQTMFNMLKEVGEGTMDENGEGSVMYIVSEDGQGQQRTVGMCKLKTSEYLIFRRMREMIKIYFAKKGNTANNFQKFKFEIENLCTHYFKPPKQLKFYFQIAEQAFKEVKKNQRDFSDDEFRYKFVTFLNKISTMVEEKQHKDANEEDEQNFEIKPELQNIMLVTTPLLSQNSQILEKILKKRMYNIDYAYRSMPTPIKPKKEIKKLFYLLHMVPRINQEKIKEIEETKNTTLITFIPNEKEIDMIVQELENANDLNKKAHLVTFIKNQNKRRTLELLLDKINAFRKSCEQSPDKLTHYHHITSFEDLLKILNGKQSANVERKEQIIVVEGEEEQFEYEHYTHLILPLLIPGSGKSTLAEFIQAQNPQMNIEILSSDKIREKLMEKERKKRKDQISIEQLYENTKKKGLQKYREAVNNAVGENPPLESKVVFIDRVFCPTTIIENMKEVNKPWVKFIIIVQKSLNNTKLNEYSYPISMKFLLNCMKRSFERDSHETLSQKPEEIVRVLLKFYQMYRGYSYEQKLAKLLEKEQINFKIIALELIEENEMDPLNNHLKRKLQECLKFITPGCEPPLNLKEKYTELIELIYKFADHIEDERNKEKETSMERTMQRCGKKIIEAIRSQKL